jgi:hypothetical protein
MMHWQKLETRANLSELLLGSERLFLMITRSLSLRMEDTTCIFHWRVLGQTDAWR